MKRPGLLIGGVIVIAIIVFGLFVAAKIAFPFYIAMHRDEMDARLAQADQRQQEQLNAQNIAEARASNTPKPAPPPEPVPRNQPTEDDWIAANVAREIVSMAESIRSSTGPLPTLHAVAQVDPAGSAVHVEIDGTSGGQIIADLKPVFAWDPVGYAPLAQKALAGTAGDGWSDPDDVMADLQELNGYKLAQADVRLSDDLQKHPASWPAHEDAAFALCALALRENAGGWSDSRRMLGRAAAHLALAQVLRGSQPETWPGLMADAALRTLSGRELDATAHLDALAARTDLPASAGPWLTALRTVATQDWRIANVTGKSPLVVRIAWFQALANDLSDGPAVSRLDQVVTPPTEDANGAMNVNVGGGYWQAPDWGRAVLASPASITVQNGWRYTEAQITLELQELNEVFNAENAPPVDGKNLAGTLAERENPGVNADSAGKPVWHAIGLGTFKDATRRHLFVAAHAGYDFYERMIGSHDDAESFRARMVTLLHGVPGADRAIEFIGEGLTSQEAADDDRSTDPADMPASLSGSMPGYVRAKQFYSEGVPFGTTYQVRFRLDQLRVDPVLDEKITQLFAQADAERQKLQDLPIRDQAIQFNEIDEATNKQINALRKNPGPTAREKALLALAPDNYDLATDQMRGKPLLAAATRFLDYNTRAFGWLELDPPDGLDEADREPILRRDAAFNPQKFFELGTLLRDEGRPDEAAAADRSGVANAVDEVGFSDAVYPLVEYDLDHGNQQEAEQLADRANSTGSAAGMCVEMLVLERKGELDKAATLGEQLQQGYGYPAPIRGLYVRHRDHFPQQYAAEVAQLFPAGMDRASLDMFLQPPVSGVRITGKHQPLAVSGLKLGDVIVACDGYRVESVDQYDVAREQDPALDLIVWSGGKYAEIKPNLPDHRFQADLDNYTPGPQ